MVDGVRGFFDGPDAATRAVRGLAERSVPADAVRVYLLDGAGAVRREVEVEDEAGVLRGVLYGAAVGASVGCVVVALTVASLLGFPSIRFLEVESLTGALRVVATAAAAGVPLGGLIGLGRWQGGRKIAVEEVGDGSIAVVCTSSAMAPVAREVFESEGARGAP